MTGAKTATQDPPGQHPDPLPAASCATTRIRRYGAVILLPCSAACAGPEGVIGAAVRGYWPGLAHRAGQPDAPQCRPARPGSRSRTELADLFLALAAANAAAGRAESIRNLGEPALPITLSDAAAARANLRLACPDDCYLTRAAHVAGPVRQDAASSVTGTRSRFPRVRGG
jgi:hypothetical protein